MCGIAGVIGEKSNKSNLTLMLKAQHHRGPDNTGMWLNDNTALGHNRLSIIDLSEEANQPFIDSANRYVLTYNGEIYNYIELKEELESSYNFVTNSDSEVLLAAFIKWGKNCLSKLNGMFSFAIYDTHTNVLFAARDRFGVKPFYYVNDEDTFYFSSEIKALMAVGVVKTPNEKVWASYFAYGSYGMPDETFWNDVNQLPGGHYLELNDGEISIKKWYHFEEEVKKYSKRESFKEVKDRYTELLRDSIKLRFRADVNVGFNISGGLDSSALLAFVNFFEESENINAYTFYTDNENYDELPWVNDMISLTNNPLNKVLLAVEDIDKKIQYLSYVQDEPFGGIPTIAYAEIFKQARKDEILVLLDGQGMDEQWAGYDYYTKKNNETIQGVNRSPFRLNVLSNEFLKLAKKPSYPTPFKDDLLDKQYRDLFFTKIPRALRFNDRVSMASSTELREPFLDYRLVEYAFAQPLEYKINKNSQKFLLREIVSEYLSDSITYAPKRPLQTPQREWLGDDLKDYIDEQLALIEHSKYASWFDMQALKKEWKSYLEGDNESSFHIWQWISLSNLIISE